MTNAIYSLIPEERLRSILETLHSYTSLKVQLIDISGAVLSVFGEQTSYCAMLNRHVFPPHECVRIHADAGKRAKDIGEAYIFTCHADLNHIAFPLVSQGELLGTVIIGPFLMDIPDSSFVCSIADKYSISSSLALSLNDSLLRLPVIEPKKVSELKKLMDHLFSPLMSSELLLLVQNQQKAYQQARVNETIQIYKEEALSADGKIYYEKEFELLNNMRSGDVSRASKALGGIIAFVCYADGGHIENLRIHAQMLLSAIALCAVDGGASSNLIYDLQKHYFVRIRDEKTVDGIIFFIQEALESFMGEMLDRNDKGNSYVRAALKYMAENYSSSITLKSTAREVGLSPNYFSSMFRKYVGVSFREQLCRIRVEESKRLLLSTDYSLTDIAIAMGFNDQSYYCKVFKKITGLAPGQYRYR